MVENPFVVFQESSGWCYTHQKGQKSRVFEKREDAERSADQSRSCYTNDRSYKLALRTFFDKDDSHIRLTLRLLGFEQMGRDRFSEWDISKYQKDRLREHLAYVAGNRFTGGSKSPPDPFLCKHRSYYDDLVGKVDWVEACAELERGACGLAIAIGTLVNRENGNHLVRGHRAWHWVASALSLCDNSVGRNLDKLVMRQDDVHDELLEFALLRKRNRASQDFLLSHVVRSFITDITSEDGERRQFVDCFSQQSHDLRECLKDEVESCRKAIDNILNCARSGRGRTLVLEFFGFDALTPLGEYNRIRDYWEGMTKSAPRKRRSTPRTSGPAMIDYSQCSLSASMVWENAPIGAGVLPAFGQTRSKKGHRA